MNSVISPYRLQDYYIECEQLIKWYAQAESIDEYGMRRMKFLLDQLCFDWCGKERRAFSGLYARILFLADQHNWPAKQTALFHSLRLYLTAENIQNAPLYFKEFPSLIKAFIHCLDFSSPKENSSAIINQFLKDTPDLERFSHPERKASQHDFLRLLFVESTLNTTIDRQVIIAEDPAQGERIQIVLSDLVSDYGLQEESSGQLNLNLVGKQHFGQQFTFLVQLFEVGSVFHVFNIHPSKQLDGFYEVGPKSIFVLEPDYLIDSSDLAECFQRKQVNPYMYFLRFLSPSKMSKPALKGNIVNAALDNLLYNENAQVADLVGESLKDQLFLAMQFGPNFPEEVIQDMLNLHWNNLRSFADKYRKDKLRIEPSFYSTYFGIQGRLDIMLEYEDDAFRKDIIELKSGKAPARLAWLNNQYQVIAYQMLLSSCFDHKRKGSSSVFYSRATESPIRDIPAFVGNMQNLMMARNLIIKVIRMIEQGAFNFASLPARIRRYEVPPFAEGDLNRMHNMFARMSTLQYTYFRVFLTFLFRELITARTGSLSNPNRQGNPFSMLWRENFQGKKEKFAIIPALRIKRYDAAQGALIFSQTEKHISSFRKGDMVLLYAYQTEDDNPLNKEFFKGNIKSISSQEITVSLRNKQCDPQIFIGDSYWAMEKDFYEKNIRSGIHSLYRFMDHPNVRAQQLILGMEAPKSIVIEKAFEVPHLMKSQQVVLDKIIAAQDYFLLQGPPGTGKTAAILLNLVRYQMQKTTSNILLLAFTNKAIDQICYKLEEDNLDFVRINHSVERPDWAFKNKMKDASFTAMSDELKKARIYVSTLASWQNKGQEILEYKSFDLLIVDEASQLTEPDLAGVLIDFPKWVLIGDQNQLPAVVVQSQELCQIEDEHLNSIGITDLRTSLFERLFLKCKEMKWDHAIDQLTDHFRMHQDIADRVKHWYTSGLNAVLPVQYCPWEWDKSSTDTGGLGEVIASGRLVFCHSSVSPTQKSHPEEAHLVIAFLDLFYEAYGAGFNGETLGVITPFRAQIAEINLLLAAKPYGDLVTVDTVERFQGAERDHILFSAAISSPIQLKAMESLSEDGATDKKLNVALSRARKQFILIGHEYSLSRSRHYAAYLAYCKSQQTVFTIKD